MVGGGVRAGQGWLAGPEAAGLGHAAVEEELAARGKEIERAVPGLPGGAGGGGAAAGGGDGPGRGCADRGERGRTRARHIFGPVAVSRIAYRAPGAAAVHRLDEQLDLPAGKHSHGLAKMTAAEAVRGSFGAGVRAGQGADWVQAGDPAGAAAGPGGRPTSTAFMPAAGAAAGRVRWWWCRPMARGSGCGRELRPRAARKAAASSRSRTGGCPRARSHPAAEVGAVWVITPAPRTAGDILGPGPRQGRRPGTSG